MSRVDDTINSKMVLCCYMTHSRYPLPVLTMEHDQQLIRFKDKVYAEHILDPSENKIIQELRRLNCMIAGMKKAVSNPALQEDDVILFKADNFYINDMQLFRSALAKVVDEGFDVVIRNYIFSYFTRRCTSGYTHDDYHLADCFLIKAGTARALFTPLGFIDRFPETFLCDIENFQKCPCYIPGEFWKCGTADLYFTRMIFKHAPSLFKINFRTVPWGDTELGFCHMYGDLAKDVPNWAWNRSGYDLLYR